MDAIKAADREAAAPRVTSWPRSCTPREGAAAPALRLRRPSTAPADDTIEADYEVVEDDDKKEGK